MSALLTQTDKEQYDELSDRAKVRYNQFRFVTNLRMQRWLGAMWSCDKDEPKQ